MGFSVGNNTVTPLESANDVAEPPLEVDNGGDRPPLEVDNDGGVVVILLGVL